MGNILKLNSLSYVYTSQQNGVVERKNGHILEQTRALLFQNNVPKLFWGKSLSLPLI